jgi:sporulation protein YlmC with PRC-barrel domain
MNEEDVVPNEERKSELRSEAELIGCRVHADNGKLGQIKDIIFDTDYWKLRHIVIQNSENFTEDEYIVCSTKDIESVDWNEMDVYVKGAEMTFKNELFYSADEILKSI